MFTALKSLLVRKFSASTEVKPVDSAPDIEVIAPNPKPIVRDKAALKIFQFLGKEPTLLDDLKYHSWCAEFDLEEITELLEQDHIPAAFKELVTDFLSIDEIEGLYKTGANRLTFAYTYSEYPVDPNGHAHAVSVGTTISEMPWTRYVLEINKRKNLVNPHYSTDFNHGLWVNKVTSSNELNYMQRIGNGQFHDVAFAFTDFIFNQYNPGVVVADGPQPRYTPGGFA